MIGARGRLTQIYGERQRQLSEVTPILDPLPSYSLGRGIVPFGSVTPELILHDRGECMPMNALETTAIRPAALLVVLLQLLEKTCARWASSKVLGWHGRSTLVVDLANWISERYIQLEPDKGTKGNQQAAAPRQKIAWQAQEQLVVGTSADHCPLSGRHNQPSWTAEKGKEALNLDP